MGRSVSYASGSIAIAYSHTDINDNEFFESTFFDDVIEDVRQHSNSLWPSLSNCDKWLGREDHAILENDHCYIGVSEYCGLVSTWLVPKEENNLSVAWCNQISNKFMKSFSTLNKVGQFSNGESFFERVNNG